MSFIHGNKPGHKIVEIFAFVVEDDNGEEGIPAYKSKSGIVFPLLTGDSALVLSLEEMAQLLSNQIGRSLKMLRFSTREEVKEIRPL